MMAVICALPLLARAARGTGLGLGVGRRRGLGGGVVVLPRARHHRPAEACRLAADEADGGRDAGTRRDGGDARANRGGTPREDDDRANRGG